jgi:hypothetical protein
MWASIFAKPFSISASAGFAGLSCLSQLGNTTDRISSSKRGWKAGNWPTGIWTLNSTRQLGASIQVIYSTFSWPALT